MTWSENGRCGLKFSGSIDVRQWRATPINTEQQRVDELVKLVKAGAVPLPVNEASEDLPDGADGLSADLRRALELLENLGDRLAKDAIVVALYPAELQNLDIAMQVIAAVGSIVSGESGVATGARKFGACASVRTRPWAGRLPPRRALPGCPNLQPPPVRRAAASLFGAATRDPSPPRAALEFVEGAGHPKQERSLRFAEKAHRLAPASFRFSRIIHCSRPNSTAANCSRIVPYRFEAPPCSQRR